MTRNDQLLLHMDQGLSVGDAPKEDDHAAGAVDGFNYGTAVLIITGRSLLAQFGLTPKSKRGLGAWVRWWVYFSIVQTTRNPMLRCR